MTHDDKFDAFLDREAERYNAPPAEVPREAMWEAIAAARAARRVALGAVSGSEASVIAVRPRRPMRHAPWMGMAATLLLGVGIGRYVLRQQGGTTLPPDTAMVASASSSATGAADSSSPVPAAPEGPAPAAVPRGEAVRFAPVARLAQETPRPSAPEPRRRDGASAPYAIASQQHLTRAEALVAVVAAMPQDAMMDSLTARWAKDVLTNTRLLLDSPAGDDPVRRRLLEDLETVLVQLVQRSGRTAEDRAMIDRTLQKTQLLTRLRSGAAGT